MTNEEDNEDGSTSKGTAHPFWKNKERTRAILTKRDRKFLKGTIELEGQSRRNTEYKIRKRVVDGILDLELIRFELPDKDWKNVFDSIFGERETNPPVSNAEFRVFRDTLMNLVKSGIQHRYGCPDTAELVRRMEGEIEESLSLLLSGGELNIDFNFRRYDTDEVNEELVEKILADKATVEDYRFFNEHWGDAQLIDEMEERGIEQFAIQRYPDPALQFDLDFLKRTNEDQ